MKKFELYSIDIESTGLDKENHDIIEVSLYRLSNDDQKTWFIKPIRTDNIEKDALRVNGHLLEDILHKTKEGQVKYIDARKALADIENWLAEDFHTADERLLIGHNVLGFDKDMLIAFWKKCNALETFPFSKRFALDTMQLEVFLDLVKDEETEYYNLGTLVEKYGIKKEKFHKAAGDCRMAKDLFLAQFKKAQQIKK